VTAARLASLDLDFFHSAFAPNNGPIEHELQSRHFLRRESPQPTVTGVLTLGKSPRNFIGSAYTHFQRIAGATLADPVQDDHELEGHILQICQQADALFRLHQPSAVSPPEYPLAAIQHLYRNAILHRDYQYFLAPIRIRWFDDRIEIHSPGGPFGHVNHRNFGAAGTISYRNPHLASSMKTLGLTQNSGLGIETARALLKENGNPELEFQVGESHVTAILRKAEL
jgi:ATP-dependent DNA helicase RecG